MGVFLVWYNYGMPDYVPQVDYGLIEQVSVVDADGNTTNLGLRDGKIVY